ncbi:MAG: alpha/beta hydrolase fold domain-containing protein [Trebonia sp.]
MSRRDLIDPESRLPLDQLLAVMPGGFNAIPDIVARREAAAQMRAAVEVPPNPNVTHEDAAELGFDPGRLAVYGGSAGGGLTIAVVLLARDRGFPAIRFQMPIYPMIDDANETASSHEITDIGVWDRAANVEAWQWYLGGGKPDQYAAPARAEDLSGLPPAFIDVGTLDLFRDEDITFAMRLMQAGVPTELHVNPGAYHAAEILAPQAALAGQIWERRFGALRRALA